MLGVPREEGGGGARLLGARTGRGVSLIPRGCSCIAEPWHHRGRGGGKERAGQPRAPGSRSPPDSGLAISTSTTPRGRESLPFYGSGNASSGRPCNPSKVTVWAGGGQRSIRPRVWAALLDSAGSDGGWVSPVGPSSENRD